MKKGLFALSLLVFIGCKKNTSDPDGTNSGNAADTVSISKMVPAAGTLNTEVTITGSNFGTSPTGVIVLFNGVQATIKSVSATEIKTLVPVTTSGPVSIVKGNRTVTGPVFTYTPAPDDAAHTNGNVTLSTQSQVDSFVTSNKGKQIQITGNLIIGFPTFTGNQTSDITSITGLSGITSVSGDIFINSINLSEAPFLNTITKAGSITIYYSAFTSLIFNNLTAFSGSFTLSNLPKLTHAHIDLTANMGRIGISQCPLLTDLSFLSNVTTASQISLNGTGASSIVMDDLTSLGAMGLSITGNNSLTSISFRSLASLPDPFISPIGGSVANSLKIAYCPLLSNLNFNALTSIGGKLALSGTNVTDLTGFASLESLGSLLLDGNPALTNLQGLEHLTRLTLDAIMGAVNAGPLPISRLNGIYIINNAKLSSLSGLQNITTIPIAYISSNGALNDLCPFKTSVDALSGLPDYSYNYNNQFDQIRTTSIAALTLTNNGSYATTQNAVDAVALCK